MGGGDLNLKAFQVLGKACRIARPNIALNFVCSKQSLELFLRKAYQPHPVRVAHNSKNPMCLPAKSLGKESAAWKNVLLPLGKFNPTYFAPGHTGRVSLTSIQPPALPKTEAVLS